MSSFLMSLLGNVAEQTGKGIENARLRQQKLDDEERLEQNAIARMQKQEDYKQEVAQRAQAAKRATIAAEMQKAREGGAMLDAEQRERELMGAGAGDVATLTPEQEAIAANFHGLQYGTPLAKINNQLHAARQGGMYEAESILESARKETVAEIASRNEKAEKDRTARRLEERDAEIARKNNLDHKEAMAKIEMESKRHAADRAGGGNTAFDRQVALLQKAGVNDQGIADFITNRKQESEAEMAYSLFKAARQGGEPITMEDATSYARQFKQLEKQGRTTAAPAASAGGGAATPPSTPASGELVYDPKTKKFTPAK